MLHTILTVFRQGCISLNQTALDPRRSRFASVRTSRLLSKIYKSRPRWENVPFPIDTDELFIYFNCVKASFASQCFIERFVLTALGVL